jgi:hypothetical protein
VPKIPFLLILFFSRSFLSAVPHFLSWHGELGESERVFDQKYVQSSSIREIVRFSCKGLPYFSAP